MTTPQQNDVFYDIQLIDSQNLLYEACKASNVAECKRLLQTAECFVDETAMSIVIKKLYTEITKNNEEIYRLLIDRYGQRKVYCTKYETIGDRPRSPLLEECKCCNIV
jgi:hypothetical protein